MFVSENFFEKNQKNLKKGVDKLFKGWYYVQARSRAQPTREQTNLENDTEQIETQTTVNNLS